ncbi:MAG: glycoside hydrolase family 2 protein [Saprospiraceae bacterium]
MRILLFVPLLLLAMLAHAQMPTYTPIRHTVYSKWEFRQAQTPDWKPTQLPTSVHTSLLHNKMIEDPFYRDNEAKLQWIEEKDWEFQSTFDVDAETLAKKHIELSFKELDTYAHIYLNDTLILETDNLFRTWRTDVKKWLKPKDNRLHIYFESPTVKNGDDWKALGYELPGGIRTMARTAQFHYGWDWGPRFVGASIGKNPEIIAWDELLIEDMYVTTQKLDEEKAVLVARFRYRADENMAVTVVSRDGKHKSLEDRKFIPGIHEDSVTFQVEHPQLWWCVGMGEAHLYDFTVEIKRDVRIIEKVESRMGIRTIELVTEKDKEGESFYFKLNGVRVFAKGANYIPQDIFQDRVTPEHTKRILDAAVASNMNMLRVWGGGIYEDDLFYQLCDARGIMVWQDFMYACALYPGNGKFLKSAAAESYEQIERLRQHPCMALWCGNNENSEAWNHWGWQMQFSEAQRKQLWRDYQILFVDILPTYVANYANGIPYWESSPKYGRGDAKSLKEGDAHYWGVWHDAEPFEVFNQKIPRFMSEYGFQSFPEWKTIEAFTLPEDRELESPVMLAHQKHPRGNELIAEYMKRSYRPTKNFEDFVYVSQLLQAEGIRTGIEAHRRNKPYCMGTLFWQLNDVWPVASWSSIDYFGRWKALQYYARDAYRPVVALPILGDDDILRIYGVSDSVLSVKATLQVRALTLEGEQLSNVTLPDLLIAPDSSRMIFQTTLKTLLDKNRPEDAVVEISLKKANGDLLYRRLYYSVPPKKLNLPRAKISLKTEQVNDGYRITLQCDRLAKNVFLQSDADGSFTDNYFDLLPGERKTVLFKTKGILDSPQSAFKAKSLVDTY